MSKFILTFPNWSDQYPLRTNYLCLHCCHSFTTVPIVLPTNKRKHFYECLGFFCSFNCARSYSFEHDGVHTGKRASYLFSLLRLMFHHGQVKIHTCDQFAQLAYLPWEQGIPNAPSRLELQVFGGSKTIEEFRQGFITVISVPLEDMDQDESTPPWYVYLGKPIQNTPVYLPTSIPTIVPTIKNPHHRSLTRRSDQKKQEQIALLETDFKEHKRQRQDNYHLPDNSNLMKTLQINIKSFQTE